MDYAACNGSHSLLNCLLSNNIDIFADWNVIMKTTEIKPLEKIPLHSHLEIKERAELLFFIIIIKKKKKLKKTRYACSNDVEGNITAQNAAWKSADESSKVQ